MEVMEGRVRARNVLREFPDYATALACYRSPEYQSAKPLRLKCATSDFLIVEGYDGTQPQPPAPPPAAAARKGYWIAHVDVTDPEGYKTYTAAIGRRSANSPGATWCAVAPARSSRARCAAAPWWWNSRATKRRSPATARLTIRR